MNDKARIGNTMARLAFAGFGALLSSLLFFTYFLMPPAGLVLGLLAPFPAVFSRLRYGLGIAVIITLAATALLTVVGDAQSGMLYLVQCGTIALLLPELLRRDFGASRSIAWTTAVNLVIYALAVLMVGFVSGQNSHQLYGLAVAEINNSMNQALAIYEKAGIKGDELSAIKQSMASAANLLVKIFPALTTLLLIIMAGCNLALIKRCAFHFDFKLRIGEFKNYRNPELMIWILIVFGFAMLLDVQPVVTSALNVLVVLGVLYFIQGMAVISSMLSRLVSSGALRLALYMLLIVQPYTAILIAAIGIFDLWGDFRTPRKQENL